MSPVELAGDYAALARGGCQSVTMSGVGSISPTSIRAAARYWPSASTANSQRRLDLALGHGGDGRGIDAARRERDRAVDFVRVIGNVANRKSADQRAGASPVAEAIA